MSALLERLAVVRASIAEAARASGRAAEDVTLIAVTKTHPASVVDDAYALGLRDFGENYAQELLDKAVLLPGKSDLRWHFIGRFQKNKINKLGGLVRLWHTISTVADAQALAARVASAEILLQVNVGDEPQKGGVAPGEVRRFAESLAGIERLVFRGLMAIPPHEGSPERHFARMRELLDDVRPLLRGPTPILSMGMSEDYALAVRHGATHVRVGSALFGPREKAQRQPG